MTTSDSNLWDEAADLAVQRGCDPDAICWETCVDDAYDDVQEHRDMRSEYRSTQ